MDLSFRVSEAGWLKALLILVPVVLVFGGGPLLVYFYVLGDDPQERQIAALEALVEADPEADARAAIMADRVYFVTVVTGDEDDFHVDYPGLRPYHLIVHDRYDIHPIDTRPAVGRHPEYARLVAAAIAYAEGFNRAMLEPRVEEARRHLEQYYRERYPRRFGT